MKNLREEIEKVFKDVKIFPEGLGYGKDSNVSHWRIVKFGELEHLVRSWALECIPKCQFTGLGSGYNKGRFDGFVEAIELTQKKIEEAK